MAITIFWVVGGWAFFILAMQDGRTLNGIVYMIVAIAYWLVARYLDVKRMNDEIR